jgi:DtxR family transcriptional regulator, Mn-dependent transcriptional regulator
MTTASVSIEDYVGAIFRMQNASGEPLPLGDLQDFFGFSPISIHEMVQKLAQHGLAEYQPYRGVKLTSKGKETAEALVRRHRIWECFLANELQVPIDEAHQLAGDLEHAAPDWVTERLFVQLGEPGFCPHGSKIGESNLLLSEIQLEAAETGQILVVTRIYPEKESVLILARRIGLHPGQLMKVIQKNITDMKIELDDRELELSGEILSCIWGVETENEP